MAFTTHCFIRKNTPELRKKLEQLGHTICKCCEFQGADWLHVCVIKDIYRTVHGVGYTDEESEIYGLVTQEEVFNRFLNTTNAVDCETNEELFFALAAMRDDSDCMQWFVNQHGYFTLCPNDNVLEYKSCYGKYQYRIIDDTYHKATVKEIIEHFKKIN